MLNQDLKKCIIWGFKRLDMAGSGKIPSNMIRGALLSLKNTHSANSNLLEKITKIRNNMYDSSVADYTQSQFMTYFFDNLKNEWFAENNTDAHTHSRRSSIRSINGKLLNTPRRKSMKLLGVSGGLSPAAKSQKEGSKTPSGSLKGNEKRRSSLIHKPANFTTAITGSDRSGRRQS